jgi:hypothetical protein
MTFEYRLSELFLFVYDISAKASRKKLIDHSKRKIPTEVGIIIMDGLVSTGK